MKIGRVRLFVNGTKVYKSPTNAVIAPRHFYQLYIGYWSPTHATGAISGIEIYNYRLGNQKIQRNFEKSLDWLMPPV